MYTWILVFLLCSWKIETLFLKWKYQKLQTMQLLKAAYSVTMNIFQKKRNFLFKSFVKVELSYVVTINLFFTAENCMEKRIIL